MSSQWARLFAAPPLDHVRTVAVESGAHGGSALTAISAAPAGTLLASAGADGSLVLWDLARARPRLLCRAQQPERVVWAHLLSPSLLASVGPAAAYMWRVEQSSGSVRLAMLRRWPVDGRVTCAAAWDQYVAAGCGELQGAGAAAGRSWGLPGASLGTYPCCATAAAADGAVRVFDAYSGTCSKLLRLHQQGVSALQHVRRGEEDLLAR